MAARKGPNPGKAPGTKHIKREPLFPPGEMSAERCELARRLALVGLDDDKIAVALGIGERTLSDWKSRYPEFAEAIHNGKHIALAPVAASLFEVAQKRTVRRTRPMVVDDAVVIAEWDEVVEGDVRAATHILAAKNPAVWSLNGPRVDKQSAAEIEQGERALSEMLVDARARQAERGVTALLGLSAPQNPLTP
jgi:hypothetical protein